MKKDYTDIAIVLDRSGSMEDVKHDTIGGFNRFLKDQKVVPGKATITLVQFDDKYEVVYEGEGIQKAAELTNQTFLPRGTTALRDAIGKTIKRVGERLKNMAEADRPEKVVFAIITDGYENASHQFDMKTISDMIAHQRDVYKWEFVFLGANQDAIAAAGNLNISAGNAMTYAANAAGISASYAAFSNNTAAYRTGKAQNITFTDQDREEQKKAGA